MSPKDLEIAPGKVIGQGHRTFVIAEIGQNHQGDIDLAKKLIQAAKKCGADCVKLQMSSLKDKFTSSALQRPYGCVNSFGPTYGQHKSHLEFSLDQYKSLLTYANEEVGVFLTASAMDPVSVDNLDSLNVPFIKVGSGDANNKFVLEKVAKLKHRNAILSTGMSDETQVEQMYHIMKKSRQDMNFVLLQCTSSYPTSDKHVHLNVINKYKEMFDDIHIGYSGHESGYVPTLGAVALGARVVERHITLDKSMKGSDHKCSLDLKEFGEMVQLIRTMENALGGTKKIMLECELACFNKLGKSVVAAKNMAKGHVVTQHDLCIKVAEPHGWPAKLIDQLLGKVCTRSIDMDQSISTDCFQ